MNGDNEVINILLNYFKKNKIKIFFSFILFAISSVAMIFPAHLYQKLIDEGFMKKQINYIYYYIILIGISYIINVVTEYYSNKKLIEIGTNATKILKDKILEKLYMLESLFLSEYDSGYIYSRLEEVSNIEGVFTNTTFNFIASILQSLLSIFLVGFYNYKFLIILLLPIPVFIIYIVFVSKNLRKLYLQTSESNAKYSGKMNNTVENIENIKSIDIEDDSKDEIKYVKNKNINTSQDQSKGVNKFSSSLSFIGKIMSLLIYFIGGILIVYDDMTIGKFLAISMYAGKIYSPIISYSGMSIIFYPAKLSIERINKFFFNKDNLREDEGNIFIDKFKNLNVHNLTVEFNNKTVLDKLNFSIKNGERLQVVGKNGSGKTTLLNVILKNLLNYNGDIYINGQNYKNVNKKSILSKFSYVPQKQYVFNDTVLNNIVIGTKNINENKLKNIINLFEIDYLVNTDKYINLKNRTIGQSGKKLSGGEIQKISICRALLKNKDVYIFDESTNNLDGESINSLKKYINNSTDTWIIIDHQNDFSDIGFRKIHLGG